MKPILVLGIGSPFGDDQLGWQAIDLLKNRAEIQAFLKNQLHLEKCDRPGLNLLTLMQGAETVFLIDAIKSDGNEGALHRWENLEIEKMSRFISSHQIGVAEAIKLGRVLNQLPKNVILYGIEITEIGFEKIAEPINQSLNLLVERLLFELVNGFSLRRDV